MSDLLSLNLLHLFTFYLASMFMVSTYRRLRQYRAIVQIAAGLPNRWPRLLKQIQKHWLVFLTWSTIRPASIVFTLMLAQIICSHLVWPRAHLTVADLLLEWWMLPPLAIAGASMLSVDLYFILAVGEINQQETMNYLDEAEHWLTTWKAPAVRVMTLGFVNPRRMVDVEVKKALEDSQGMLTSTLWWVSLQTGLRVVFGLILWVMWAVHPSISKETVSTQQPGPSENRISDEPVSACPTHVHPA